MPPKAAAAKKAANKAEATKPNQPGPLPGPSYRSLSQDKMPLPAVHVPVAGRHAGLDDIMRQQMEISFTTPVTGSSIPPYGSTRDVEILRYQRDNDMLDYLEDFPVSEWIISSRDAHRAIAQMRARVQARKPDASTDTARRQVPGQPSSGPEMSLVASNDSFPRRQSASTLPASATASLGIKVSGGFVPINKIKESTAPFAVTVGGAATETTGAGVRAGGSAHSHEKTEALFRAILGNKNILPSAPPSLLTSPPSQDSSPKETDRGLTNAQPITEQPGRHKRKHYASEPDQPPVRSHKKKNKHLTSDSPPYLDAIPDIEEGPCRFPWESQYAADPADRWDDSIYSTARSEHIRAVHERNMRLVANHINSTRNVSQKKTRHPEAVETPEQEPKATKTQTRGQKPKKANRDEGRGHFHGRLDFASEADKKAFDSLMYEDFEDAIEAAMRDPQDEALMEIEVVHAGGSSVIPGLETPRVSIMDIARTRLQLKHIHILSDRAAECIIDFCPDSLQDYRLLQIVSETSYANTKIQARLGNNGVMLSDSTITKRISGALALEYNKVAASKGKENDPEFIKTNRKTYEKYKAWRSWKMRSNYVKERSTFDLAAAAAAYADEGNYGEGHDGSGAKMSKRTKRYLDVVKGSRISDASKSSDLSDVTKGSRLSDATKKSDLGDVVKGSRLSDLFDGCRLSDASSKAWGAKGDTDKGQDEAEKHSIASSEILGTESDEEQDYSTNPSEEDHADTPPNAAVANNSTRKRPRGFGSFAAVAMVMDPGYKKQGSTDAADEDAEPAYDEYEDEAPPTKKVRHDLLIPNKHEGKPSRGVTISFRPTNRKTTTATRTENKQQTTRRSPRIQEM